MRYRYQMGEQIFEILVERQGGQYRAVIAGQAIDFEVLGIQSGEVSLKLGERILRLYLANDGGRRWISADGCTYQLEKPAQRRAGRPGEHPGEDSVRAPMPAQVRSVEVLAGDEVEKGQTLLLLEAMKMEIRIQAPHAGRVIQTQVQAGQPVERDQILVLISRGEAGN